MVKKEAKIALFCLLISPMLLVGCTEKDPVNDIVKSVEQLEKKQMTYVALGDSYTIAYNVLATTNQSYLDYSYATGSKVNGIVNRLEAEGYNVTYSNLASPGTTSEDVIKSHLADAVAMKPQLVTIFLAGNDMRYNITPAQLANNLNLIIDELKGSEIILLNIPNIVEMRKAPYDSCKIKFISLPDDEILLKYGPLYNDAIAFVGKANNLKVVDVYSNLGKEDVNEFDCVHTSISGQEKIAQLIWNCWKDGKDCVKS